MSNQSNQHQVDIFNSNHQQKQFAELCNALYERELHFLAVSGPKNLSLLQRRLGGLAYHIKNAAENLLNHNAPIEVDVHNASWQAKQSATCIAKRHDDEKTEAWFKSHSKMGLAVPVYVSNLGDEHVELDSIDRLELEENKLHLNKHGWFSLTGECLQEIEIKHQDKRLLKPSKNSIVAACCGHSWNHKGKIRPRTLTLRELLLSTTINWKDFR